MKPPKQKWIKVKIDADVHAKAKSNAALEQKPFLQWVIDLITKSVSKKD